MHKQHFLLSAKARTLSVRWGAGEEVACPSCGAIGKHFQRTRKQWRCRDCNHTFSGTSGTIFAFHNAAAAGVAGSGDLHQRSERDFRLEAFQGFRLPVQDRFRAGAQDQGVPDGTAGQ